MNQSGNILIGFQGLIQAGILPVEEGVRLLHSGLKHIHSQFTRLFQIAVSQPLQFGIILQSKGFLLKQGYLPEKLVHPSRIFSQSQQSISPFLHPQKLSGQPRRDGKFKEELLIFFNKDRLPEDSFPSCQPDLAYGNFIDTV